MYFQHSSEIWRDHPALVPGVLFADGVDAEASVAGRTARFEEIARKRLADVTEAQLPEIQAWRRTFSRMGLEPTRHRSAAESLLRRFRREGRIPRIHPLVDLCNSVSLAFAIPIAAFDTSRITDFVEVRRASGSERYVTFSGEVEHPEVGEVIFADAAGHAHARRWTNRQSAESAVRQGTRSVLIVAEALHDSASADVERLVAALVEEIEAVWSVEPRSGLLSASAPRFEL
jgi:DNA/RNA-binding domain of Phe-tRNA-synthetase-like protein